MFILWKEPIFYWMFLLSQKIIRNSSALYNCSAHGHIFVLSLRKDKVKNAECGSEEQQPKVRTGTPSESALVEEAGFITAGRKTC